MFLLCSFVKNALFLTKGVLYCVLVAEERLEPRLWPHYHAVYPSGSVIKNKGCPLLLPSSVAG